MGLEITLSFSILIGVFALVLTVRVIDLRDSPVTRSFHSANREINPLMLQRAIRAHGNLLEYAPLFLILLFLCEFNQLNKNYLIVSATLFFIGRLMHGVGYGFFLHSPVMRIGGMALTILGFLMLLTIASLKLFVN